MKTVTFQIPEAYLVGIKIPKYRLQHELEKELALQLYREGLISFANAHRLAKMSKLEFHFLLGEREIPRQYDLDEYEQDLKQILV